MIVPKIVIFRRPNLAHMGDQAVPDGDLSRNEGTLIPNPVPGLLPPRQPDTNRIQRQVNQTMVGNTQTTTEIICGAH
nr:PREDICTED: uncharacterized protein LOC103314032 isoform X2 [Tribolium castaneum]|eukprot:XP_015839715.1 PREDICTED: uncharacterized protein LOC103314032 isoform X2 [Tribolium castaneum]